MYINIVSLGKISGIEQFPFVVVGSGFYGLTVAEQISSRLNLPVLVLEKRSHIGGNAFSYFDSETGIEIHIKFYGLGICKSLHYF